MNFNKFDDRTSPEEAAPNLGFLTDAYGNDYDSRPDNVIKTYMSKVAMTSGEYWNLQKLLTNRSWFEMETFLERMLTTANTDDKIRIQKSIDVVQKIQEGN